MELEGLHYEIRAEVKFTPEEVDFLIERAKTHYDDTCQSAGLTIEDGARENGFIAQLRMFSRTNAVWTFRQLDLTLKILEHRGYTDILDPTRRRLFKEINAVCDTMKHHKELQEEEHKCQTSR